MAKVAENTEIYLDHSARIIDYIALLKPRVMSLVVFTAFAGIMLAPKHIHPFLAFLSIIFTSLGSGAAGCLNMWYDRDIDSIMLRTKNRPIVSGRVHESDALACGIFLSVISIVGMTVCLNLLSGLLLAVTIGFYYFIYTVWLKRTSAQNIVIGGAAGAFPPMIGWASVTNSIDFNAFILFLIIFLWTPPHFWALALYKSDDYKKANIPMMPVIYGAEYTKLQILIYTILMVISTILPYVTGLMGSFYMTLSSIFNLYFIYLAVKLYRENGKEIQSNVTPDLIRGPDSLSPRTRSGVQEIKTGFRLVGRNDTTSEDIFSKNGIKTAPKLFGYSIIYLFTIFGAMIIDKL